MASLVAQGVKNSPTNAKDMRSTGLIPGSGRSPGGQHGEHSWKSHGQRSLAGYSLWVPGRLQSMGLQRVEHS